MALRNTSERYEYIYGSNVRKLETDTAGKQTAKTVPAKKNLRRPEQRRTGNKAADSEAAAAIQKNAAKFLAFDWKYTLVALIAVIICSAAAMFYLHANAQLNVMEKQISDLKTEKTSLESKQYGRPARHCPQTKADRTHKEGRRHRNHHRRHG